MNEKEQEAAQVEAWDSLIQSNRPWDSTNILSRDLFFAGFDAGIQHSRLPADGPVDVILFCPECKEQHIDKAEPDVCELCGITKDYHDLALVPATAAGACDNFTAWLNPPHKKHRCHNCNHVWKAAAIPTNGVAEITPPPTEKEER